MARNAVSGEMTALGKEKKLRFCEIYGKLTTKILQNRRFLSSKVFESSKKTFFKKFSWRGLGRSPIVTSSKIGVFPENP